MSASNGYVIGLTKVHDAGPATQKLNIVVVAEGFEAGDMADFRTRVDELLDFMLQEAPFDEEEIACGFNLYRLEVASDETGADDPDCDGAGAGTTADTYFDASFCWDGQIRRLLYCDTALVIDKVDDHLPEWHAIVVLVNSTIRGGGGGTVAVLSTGSSDWKDVALHEMGHSLFGLADEYDYYQGCSSGETDRDNYTGGEPSEPNVTANTNAATLKWSALVTSGAAIPTMSNPDCTQCNNGPSPVAAGTVGLFEGARYFHCGAYRPEYSCRMRVSTADYCAVCQQEIRDVMAPYAQSANIALNTASINFNDVPEGVTTIRAASWTVESCLDKTFTVVSGPTDAAFSPFDGTTALSEATGPGPRQAYLWFQYTGGAPGSTANGSVTIRCEETGDEWTIPLTANSVARPTVVVQLVFDQSGSMTLVTADGRTREQVLRDSASVLVDLLYPDSGIGMNTYDQDPHPLMEIEPAGAVGIGLGRLHARSSISTYAANPAGMTAIGDGIELARQKLNAASGYDQKAMIVFTDGIETAPQYVADVAASVVDSRVFAIGMGNASDIQPATLNALTDNTGGYLLMTGTLSSDDVFLLSKYYLQILAGVSNNDIVLDPEGVISAATKTVVRIPFDVADTDIEITTTLLSDIPSALEYVVETPGGELIHPGIAASDPTVDHSLSAQSAFYRFSLPHVSASGAASREGRWHVLLGVNYKNLLNWLRERQRDLSDEQIASYPVRYNVSVQAYSNLKMQARLLQNHHGANATFTLRATLTEYGAPLRGSATVWAEITEPDGTQSTLSLDETQQGVFEASVVPASTGVLRARVRGQGETRRGLPFTREQLVTGVTWVGGDRPWEPPRDGRPEEDGLERLLKCLCTGKMLSPELMERLEKSGLNIRALLECVCARRADVTGKISRIDPEIVKAMTTLNRLLK